MQQRENGSCTPMAHPAGALRDRAGTTTLIKQRSKGGKIQKDGPSTDDGAHGFRPR